MSTYSTTDEESTGAYPEAYPGAHADGSYDATPGEAFNAMVVENPLPAVLAAAAVGAGLMALVTLMAPSGSSKPEKAAKQSKKAAKKAKARAASLADDAQDEVVSLRSQLADLAKSVLASFPSKGQLQSRADDAADDARSYAQAARDAIAGSVESARGTLKDSVKSATSGWKSASQTAADSATSSLKTAGDSIRSVLGDTLEQASDVLQKYQPQVDAVTKLARQNPMWAALIAGAAGTLIGWQLLGSRDDR